SHRRLSTAVVLPYTSPFRSTARSRTATRRLPLRLSFTNSPPTEIYTLSLHDALPILADLRANLPAGYDLAITGSIEKSGKGEASDRKSTRLNSSHVKSSYAVFCLKKKNIAAGGLQGDTLKSEEATAAPQLRR